MRYAISRTRKKITMPASGHESSANEITPGDCPTRSAIILKKYGKNEARPLPIRIKTHIIINFHRHEERANQMVFRGEERWFSGIILFGLIDLYNFVFLRAIRGLYRNKISSLAAEERRTKR